MAKVNTEVCAEDRDRLRELTYREREPGQRPLTMGEAVALLLDHYVQASS